MKDEETGRSHKSIVQIAVTFSDSDRHSGRGRGRGAGASGTSRHAAVTSDELVPNVTSEEEFPCLS